MAYAYQIVVDDILARIQRGEWREGQQIPPLAELEKLYPQSRMTLYKALQHLTDSGHLTMARGRGTFVRAANPRQRIAILTGAQVFGQGVATFAMQAFLQAHRLFAKQGMDAQLYTEDPLSPTSIPTGLLEELEKRKLSGLMTVMASFPWRFMGTAQWRACAIPHVHLGPGTTPHSLDVDRGAFLDIALRAAAARGRRRVALLERAEHFIEHAEQLRRRCADLGLSLCPPPREMPDHGLTYEAYGYELLRTLWAQTPAAARPDALIVPDDVIAKGVSQAALSLSIAVPRDVTLIAMTNSGCRFFFPMPVVEVEVDVESMVAEGIGMLTDLIHGVAVPNGNRWVPPRSPAPDAVAPGQTEPAGELPPKSPSTKASSTKAPSTKAPTRRSPRPPTRKR